MGFSYNTWGTSWGTAWGESWGGGVQPPETIPMGGAGYPTVNWQGKRRKATLADRPNEHLRQILDRAIAEYYGEILDADLPKSVKAEAADVVRPFVEKQARGARLPKVEKVDWLALQQDARAVTSLVRIWRDEIARDDDDEDAYLMMMN